LLLDMGIQLLVLEMGGMMNSDLGQKSASLGAGDDLGDLLRDGSLTGPVELQAQVSDHFVGILGSGIHCAAAGSLFSGAALAQGTVKDATR